jgi:hypothetical protein
MAEFTFPSSSRIPLSILALPMREYIETNIAPSSSRTRLRIALLNKGVLELPVWFYLALPAVDRFMEIDRVGKEFRRMLDEALAHSGGMGESLGSMTELWHFAEELGEEFHQDRYYGDVVLAVIAGSVCSYSHFSSNAKLVAVLQRHGLRPGMPIDELFVYDAHAGDPPKPTVAEELLAFGAMHAWSVLTPYDFELDLNPDRTIIELWAELAVWPEPASPIIVQRRIELIAAARLHLSPEALMRIGYAED